MSEDIEPGLWYTLEPHTSEWYELLMRLDMQRAMHTMHIIAASGGDPAICGICGDVPAQDYPDLRRNRLHIRLCDDCVEIRTLSYGEHYGSPKGSPGHLLF